MRRSVRFWSIWVGNKSIGRGPRAMSTTSTNFTLLGTLWVTGFGIDALGAVALSDHSLHAVGGGTSDVMIGKTPFMLSVWIAKVSAVTR